MKILIIGSAAREHALARALLRSPQKPEIYCFASTYNPGLMELAAGYSVGDLCSVDEVLEQAQKWRTTMAIIGPEAPLENGLADHLNKAGIPTLGPTKALAQIETSKIFARDLLKKHSIPGSPRYQAFRTLEGVQEFLKELGNDNFVIKANGLAAGKGVKVAGDHLQTLAEAYQYCLQLNKQGQAFVIEEKLQGPEFSLLCFTDGETLAPMPLVQDHKRAFVGNKGPNTGGMGSYSMPDHRLPFLSDTDIQAALAITEKSLQALMEEVGERYRGIIYGGFMATRDGVRLIEFNARFGDPEALNLLSILDSDLVAICQAMLVGKLKSEEVRFAALATVCKYAVPEGYPDHPIKNAVVDLSGVENPELLYLAGLQMMDNKIFTTSSRAVAIVGKAKSLAQAEKIAEAEIKRIKGRLVHREDIGKAKLIQASVNQLQTLRQNAPAPTTGEVR